MPKLTQYRTEIRRDDDLDEKEFRALITNTAEDRHGTAIDPDGVDVKAYMRNPVLLYQHEQRQLPIGHVKSLKRVADGIEAQFVVDGETELERVIIAKLNSGTLNGVSIGFLPKEQERRDDGVVEITESELVELSVVTIQSNPEAVITSRSLIDDHLEAKDLDETNERAGAVLSRKNKDDLKSIVTLAKGILGRASDDDEDEDEKEYKTIEQLEKRIADLEFRLADIEGNGSISDNKGERSSNDDPYPEDIIDGLYQALTK